MCVCLCPLLCRLIIGFVSDPEEAAWKGYVYAALLFVVAMVQAAFLQQYFHRGYIVGMRMRTVLMAAVYKKVVLIYSMHLYTNMYVQYILLEVSCCF